MATWEVTLPAARAKYASTIAEAMAEKLARGILVTTAEKKVGISTETENNAATQSIGGH